MYTDVYKESWKTFFTRLPCEGDTYRPEEHQNVLALLYRDYCRKAENRLEFKPIPVDQGEYMTYRLSLVDGDKRSVK